MRSDVTSCPMSPLPFHKSMFITYDILFSSACLTPCEGRGGTKSKVWDGGECLQTCRLMSHVFVTHVRKRPCCLRSLGGHLRYFAQVEIQRVFSSYQCSNYPPNFLHKTLNISPTFCGSGELRRGLARLSLVSLDLRCQLWLHALKAQPGLEDPLPD